MFTHALAQYGKIATSAITFVTKSILPDPPKAKGDETARDDQISSGMDCTTRDDGACPAQAEPLMTDDGVSEADIVEIIAITACEKPIKGPKAAAARPASSHKASSGRADPAAATRMPPRQPARFRMGSFVPTTVSRKDGLMHDAIMDVLREDRAMIFRLRAGSEITGQWSGKTAEDTGRILLEEILAHPHLTCSRGARPGKRILRVDLDVSSPGVATMLVAGYATSIPEWHEVELGITLKDMGVPVKKMRGGEVAFSLGPHRFKITRSGLRAT